MIFQKGPNFEEFGWVHVPLLLQKTRWERKGGNGSKSKSICFPLFALKKTHAKPRSPHFLRKLTRTFTPMLEVMRNRAIPLPPEGSRKVEEALGRRF